MILIVNQDSIKFKPFSFLFSITTKIFIGASSGLKTSGTLSTLNISENI